MISRNSEPAMMRLKSPFAEENRRGAKLVNHLIIGPAALHLCGEIL